MCRRIRGLTQTICTHLHHCRRLGVEVLVLADCRLEAEEAEGEDAAVGEDAAAGEDVTVAFLHMAMVVLE
jgi:hypothetical protein